MELVKKKLKLLPFFNIFLLLFFCFPFWIRILEGKCMRFRVHSPVEKSRVSLCLASEYLKRWFFRLVICWVWGRERKPSGEERSLSPGYASVWNISRPNWKMLQRWDIHESPSWLSIMRVRESVVSPHGYIPIWDIFELARLRENVASPYPGPAWNI